MADKEESREVAIRDADFSDIQVMGNGAGALTEMGPFESMMSVFEEIRDNTATLVDLVASSIQGDAADRTAEDLAGADVAPAPEADPKDDEKGGGLWKRTKDRFANLGAKAKFALLMGGLALIMTFADEIAVLLAPVLKVIKEKVWPNAIDLFMDAFEGVKKLFTDVWDRLQVIFDPETSILEKVTALVGIIGDFGAFLWGIGNSIITNVLEMFGVNFAPYDSAGAWILGKLNDMWEGIKTWFSEAGTWVVEGATGIWNWITGKIDAVWTGVTTWFSETGTSIIEGFTGIWDWMKGAIAPVWDFVKDLFTWPDSPEGFVTKLIDIILLPYNLAINFLRGIFGWGEKDEEGQLEKFSLGEFIVGKVKEAWEWIKEKFTFDIPKLKLPQLPNFGDMIKGVIGSMLPDPDSWLGKALYKFKPNLLDFKISQSSPDIDVSMDADTGGTGETGKTKSMHNVWSDEMKSNAMKMKELEGMDDDTMLPDGHTVESKKFALEMRQNELGQLIDPQKITKLDSTNELADVKKEQLGLDTGHMRQSTIIAPVTNTDNSVKDESVQIVPLGVIHDDPVVEFFAKPSGGRKALGARGY